MTVMCKLELREEEEVRVRRFADDASDPAAARASFIVKLATVLKQIVETSLPQESSTKRYHVPPLHKHFAKLQNKMKEVQLKWFQKYFWSAQ